MPYKWYHGKTGVVWNVTKRAIGVEVMKAVSPMSCHAQGQTRPQGMRTRADC